MTLQMVIGHVKIYVCIKKNQNWELFEAFKMSFMVMNVGLKWRKCLVTAVFLIWRYFPFQSLLSRVRTSGLFLPLFTLGGGGGGEELNGETEHWSGERIAAAPLVLWLR